MFRFTNLAILGLGSVLAANAGQIQIGGVNGLTSSTVNAGVGSAGAYTEQNYDTVLFSGATESSVAPTPYTGYNTGSGGTLTDSTNHVTFSMINQTGNAADNFWGGTQSGCSAACVTPTITVPIGLFDVTDVWTMINTELALASATVRDSSVVFYFGTSANEALASDDKVTVKLFDSLASGSAQSGETQNGVVCSSSCGSPAFDGGPTLPGPTVISGLNVLTGNVYTSAYNNALGAYGNSSSGNVVLDDQGFLFNNLALTGAFAGDTNLNTYLVAVQVVESGGGNGVSTALSAITVDTAAGSTSTTPEPATVLLFLTGLGAIGLARFRRA